VPGNEILPSDLEHLTEATDKLSISDPEKYLEAGTPEKSQKLINNVSKLEQVSPPYINIDQKLQNQQSNPLPNVREGVGPADPALVTRTIDLKLRALK
jgi:hypothetical protein